jgi:hypothetical protein
MNSTNFPENKYLRKFFESDESIRKEKFNVSPWLKTMLLDVSDTSRIFRNHLDICLELAYRKNIVDDDFKARITNQESTIFEATYYELKVAKLLENRGNEIEFHPNGRKKKVLEFRIKNQQSSCLIEVKTLLESEEDKKWFETHTKLREILADTGLPFIFTFSEFTLRKDFSKNDLRRWLDYNLRNMSSKQEVINLTYTSKSGFSVNIYAYPRVNNSDRQTYIKLLGAISWRNEIKWPGIRITNKIHKATKQLNTGKEACLIILCDESNSPKFEEDIQALIYGRKYIDNDFILPNQVGAFLSINKNRRVSGVGLYYSIIHKGEFHEELDLYHHPNPLVNLDHSMFSSSMISHYILDQHNSRIVRL